MFQSYFSVKRLSIATIVGLLSSTLQAGVVYEIEVKDHEQSPPKTETVQAAVEGRNLKMGIAAKGKGSQGDMIFRGDRREMIVIDHERQSYHVMDEETMNQIAGQVNDAMSQMQEALKNVPADKRAMIEQMMKQKMPSQAPESGTARNALKNTGERAKKMGYPCVKYEILKDNRKIRELWVTDWKNIEGGKEVVGAYEDMADFFHDMMAAMPKMGQSGSGINDNMFEHMKEMGGFPVIDREFDDNGSLESEGTLQSARREKLDPDAFEPPAGYKRQDMFSR